MDFKIFRQGDQSAFRSFSLMDMLMILISNKVRYVFILVLGLMWFRNDSGKKVVLNAMN